MTLLAIKLFLGGWLKRLWGFVSEHPWQAACIALLALAWWQHSTVTGLRKDLTAMERARDAERAAHRKTVQNYREASKRAVALAVAEKERKEKEYRHAAQQADRNYTDLQRSFRAALLQRTSATDNRSPGQADLPGDSGASRFPENRASASGVLISQSDALKTADLAAYGQACYLWADGLAKGSNRPTETRVSDRQRLYLPSLHPRGQ